jgi:hypothetical protein
VPHTGATQTSIAANDYTCVVLPPDDLRQALAIAQVLGARQPVDHQENSVSVCGQAQAIMHSDKEGQGVWTGTGGHAPRCIRRDSR